jgi:hypothetical protein
LYRIVPQAAEAKLAAKRAAEQEQALRKMQERAPARQLAAAMMEAGWKLSLPQFSIGERERERERERGRERARAPAPLDPLAHL